MKIIAVLSIVLFSAYASSTELLDPQVLLVSEKCVLQIVATKMGIHLDPKINPPSLRVQNTTSLQDFQEAMEKFWHFRPDSFTNAYNPITNEIFIMTEIEYYQKHNRFALDSLAHEMVHYLQKEYFHSDFQGEEGFEEFDAVYYQNWFREAHRIQLEKNVSPCLN